MEFEIVVKIFWAVLVSLGFAVLFNVPRRAMVAVAILGAVGFGVKTILVSHIIEEQLVLSALAGASAVGILGAYFAHLVHTPPIVFTIPAVINMVPGTLGHKFMIGLLNIISEGHQNMKMEDLIDIINDGLNAGFIILVLAFGIVFPILIFNTETVKNKNLNKYLKKQLLVIKRKLK